MSVIDMSMSLIIDATQFGAFEQEYQTKRTYTCQSLRITKDDIQREEEDHLFENKRIPPERERLIHCN